MIKVLGRGPLNQSLWSWKWHREPPHCLSSILVYFKGRNFREQKLSRISRIFALFAKVYVAKFSELSHSRKFLFTKFSYECHSRKFMFAKCKNFAKKSVRESFCLRKFLPLKYIYWTSGTQSSDLLPFKWIYKYFGSGFNVLIVSLSDYYYYYYYCYCYYCYYYYLYFLYALIRSSTLQNVIFGRIKISKLGKERACCFCRLQ